MHILMANFNGDLKNAAILANYLIDNNLEVNLIDSEGKSPLHVAVKKQQIEAL